MALATYLTITNATTGNLSLSGDDGKPDISLGHTSSDNSQNVYLTDVIGNVSLCDTLSAWITSGNVVVTRGSVTITAAVMLTFKEGGDMMKDVYDANDDGTIDDAATNATAIALNTTHRSSDGTDHANVVLNDTHRASDGTDHANVVLNDTHRASDGTDHANVVLNDTHRAADGKDHSDVVLNNTHRASDGTDHANVVLNDTHRASDGTDHANVVLNDTHRASDGTDHANVVLNDTHRAADGKDHSDVVLNNTHRASDGTDHANVVLNDTHRASDGKDHSDVVLNNTHRAADGKDHSDVVLNNTHRTNVDPKLVQVVITATGGSGGSTAGTISVQVNDLAGNAISRAVNIRLDISDTEGAGSLDAATTCQFGAASTGTLVIGNGAAAAIVTTDATGLYEGALANSADETNYFSASSTPGGAAALANGCDVVECAIESATWSA